MMSGSPSSFLETFFLGVIPFDDLLPLQQRLVYEIGESDSDVGGYLLLCEHPPTLSVGRAGSRTHILPDDDWLRRAGIKVQWVARGGGCLLHVPGQIQAYLIMPLDRMGLTLADYFTRLNDLIARTLAEFDLKGEVKAEQPGVFLGYSRVASIGVAVNRWIAYHGFSINVGPHLRVFEILDEPGLEGQRLRQTSMEARRQRPVSMSGLRESVLRHTESVFGLERHHIYTWHPLLGRRKEANVFASSVG